MNPTKIAHLSRGNGTYIYIYIYIYMCVLKEMCNMRFVLHMGCRIGKLTNCICENKDADQLCSNCKADQRLCFRYSDSTIPLFSKSKISSFKPASMDVQPGLCQTWSETQIVGCLP